MENVHLPLPSLKLMISTHSVCVTWAIDSGVMYATTIITVQPVSTVCAVTVMCQHGNSPVMKACQHTYIQAESSLEALYPASLAVERRKYWVHTLIDMLSSLHWVCQYHASLFPRLVRKIREKGLLSTICRSTDIPGSPDTIVSSLCAMASGTCILPYL